ncbi:tRNA (N6-threonylcarbamoyladenosine(37)-N6)-methyltransferase TrmO [Thermosulfurimonas marina]|uniref:tRNA (N6-threonylcarbamoyladenosine(37)-N6)-methyltransferase TrmO n=1 Tax=Thermosulfurimonas marina TaxID=2047767 RepID=A0A6H1WT85_9BACT|nr:tRNA (N6-threonylcarbamoyladenosine(37)-N6)-methyltransferase TrmO [Thermosulfurimonas marina]QJA06336.1 tRNA (N6-threonylcarbamoyladenosine(37)-N6)-methyltransferase TrmO [Thermosulfurimonas marina]
MAQEYVFKPIGFVRTKAREIPRHWSVSKVEGELVIDPAYEKGLQDLRPGERLVVLFVFDRAEPFGPDKLLQTPPHRQKSRGVFSTCSPVRPNPIGLSVVEILEVRGPVIRVRGLDMFDGTPILDLKPYKGYAADESGDP